MAKDGREVLAGINVGRDRLEVHIRPQGQHLVGDNDQAGWPSWRRGSRPWRAG